MNKATRLLILSFGCAVFLFGCKTKKQGAVIPPVKPKVMEQASANAKLLQAIAANENQFNYYLSRGSARYKDPEQEYNLNMEIIMEKDQYVYINVTALLGISVARIWMTKDSVSILDILHKKCIISSFDFIRKSTNVDLNLKQIQHIFSGNTLFQGDAEKMTADTILSYILVNTPISATQVQTTYYQQSTFKVSRWNIADHLNGRELRAEYNDGHQQGSNYFPKDMTINIKAEKNIVCDIQLDYFAFDKKKETKFVVPKNFETIRR